MSKKRKTNKTSQQGDVMRRQAWESKRDAMRGNFGAPGPRAWRDQNKRAVAAKKACRGKVNWA